MTWRAAVKLAYDGQDFFGSQRQPEVPTVEAEVIRALRRIKAIEDPQTARFRTASRTDRGVSALGNVVAFDTSFRGRSLLKALNAVSESVFFYAWAEVPKNFSPRRAQARWYRYFLPCQGLDISRVEKCAGLFLGEHDFRRFCKPDGWSSVRTLDKLSVTPTGDFLVIDLEAREFLRNMVRRIVAALREVGAGRRHEEDVRRALEGEDIQFGLAPPEKLWLMDVRYPFEFTVAAPPGLLALVKERSQSAKLKLSFYDSLASRF
ncbi:MAG: tRNA pseudouridine(38-40) synthase TruA [Methanomassiliicoccales archaeon]